MGSKRRFDPLPAISGLPRSTDVVRPSRHFSKGPRADVMPKQTDSADDAREWLPSCSDIRFNNSDVPLYSIPEKLVGSLIGRAFVRGLGTFDAIELDEYNPFV